MNEKKNDPVVLPTDVEELDKMKKSLEECNFFRIPDEVKVPEDNILPQYKLVFGGKEYYVVCFEGEDGNDFFAPIDELVALTFVPNPNNYKYIRHINGNTLDSRAENLEWVEKLTD